jgi:hypothetical protein
MPPRKRRREEGRQPATAEETVFDQFVPLSDDLEKITKLIATNVSWYSSLRLLSSPTSLNFSLSRKQANPRRSS